MLKLQCKGKGLTDQRFATSWQLKEGRGFGLN